MSDPRDPFEQHLAEELRALADGETAPLGLAAATEARAEELARQRHHRRIAGGGGLALLGAAAVWLLVVVVADPDDGGTGRVRTADGSTTTTTEVLVTSTTLHDIIVVDETTTTLRPRSTTTTVPDGPPEPKCVEVTGAPNDVRERWTETGTYSPSRYWATQPEPDRPMSLRACVDDITPRVGQTITVTLVADDPDQPFFEGSCNRPAIDWGDEPSLLGFCNDASPPPPETPAPTPAPGPAGHAELTESHAFEAAGSFTVGFSATSGRDTGGPEPYRSGADTGILVTVHE